MVVGMVVLFEFIIRQNASLFRSMCSQCRIVLSEHSLKAIPVSETAVFLI